MAEPPSTSPSPREGQRLCPCRGVTTSPGNLGLALPPSQRLSQGDQFVHLRYLPNKHKTFARLFCAHVSQNHWGLFLRGYWFNSSLHWWKELLTRAVGSRRAAGTGGDGSGGAAGTDTWQKFLLGNLPLAPALHLLQMEDSEGWRDFLIYFLKKIKRGRI